MKLAGKNYIDISAAVVVVLLIIFFISGILLPKLYSRPYYKIQMNDVNGLIVGSPVLLSGHLIGHVTKVYFEDSHISVIFVLDGKVVKKLPPNCELVVKSSGMGGSRSIDIYQFPTKQDMDLKIRETVRQAQINNVQVQIAKQMINSGNSIDVMLPEEKLRDLKYFMKEGIVTENYATIFDKILKYEDNLQHMVNTKLKDFNSKLAGNKYAKCKK